MLAVGLMHSITGFSTETARVVEPKPMLEIRNAALKGDAASQCLFAHSYQLHQDLKSAFTWYRKAARQGVGEAQFQVGQALMSGLGIGQNSSEGVKWLSLAANQKVPEAEVALGNWYLQNKKYVEAFKWYSLATREQPFQRSNVDALILKMSGKEIEEGQKQVNGFKPSRPEKMAVGFKLQALMGKGEMQLALINGKAFKSNESGTIKVDDELVKIQCIEVTPQYALIVVDGDSTPLMLSLETKP